jgi:hypothetical protein
MRRYGPGSRFPGPYLLSRSWLIFAWLDSREWSLPAQALRGGEEPRGRRHARLPLPSELPRRGQADTYFRCRPDAPYQLRAVAGAIGLGLLPPPRSERGPETWRRRLEAGWKLTLARGRKRSPRSVGARACFPLNECARPSPESRRPATKLPVFCCRRTHASAWRTLIA